MRCDEAGLNLFHRVILQEGSALDPATFVRQPRSYTLSLASRLNCSVHDAASTTLRPLRRPSSPVVDVSTVSRRQPSLSSLPPVPPSRLRRRAFSPPSVRRLTDVRSVAPTCAVECPTDAVTKAVGGQCSLTSVYWSGCLLVTGYPGSL